MYRKIDDFIEDWEEESASTLKIFRAIPQTKMLEVVSKSTRSLGGLAWHITVSITEMLHRVGLFDKDQLENEPLPISMDEICESYHHWAGKVTEHIRERWKDDNLNEVVNMYGEDWKNGKTLQVLIRHQAHHRAQMTVLMRLLDLKVAGVYGPSREEWAAMGMKAPD